MKKKYGLKTKWTCILLCICMILSSIPVYASGDTEASAGICSTHHPKHTAECGYSPATEGHACEHICSEECWQTIVQCIHVHGSDGCTYQEMQEDVPASGECNHAGNCTEESGCIVKIASCIHTEHNAECGYEEAKAAVPCSLTVCPQCEAEKAAAEQKAAEEKAAAEKAAADAAKVAEVQALIDALPETVTQENKDNTGNQLNTIIAAYGNLDDSLKPQINLTKYESTIAAMYELEGMAGAQEPQYTDGDSIIYIWDRVCQENVYDPGITAVNDNGQTVKLLNNMYVSKYGFSRGKTYTVSINPNSGYELISTDFKILNDGYLGANSDTIYITKQYTLTVKVVDSLGNSVTGKEVSLNLPDGTRKVTTDAAGTAVFSKIRGLYSTGNKIVASASYVNAFGETATAKTGYIDMYNNKDHTVTLTIPSETKLSIKVQGVPGGNDTTTIVDNDISNATVTVKNKNDESFTLTHQSDGTYTGAVKRTVNGSDTFSVTVSANGYQSKTISVKSSNGNAISQTVSLPLADLTVNGITNNQVMTTGTAYTISIPESCIPEDAEFICKATNGNFNITGSNGTWILVPTKEGSDGIDAGYKLTVSSPIQRTKYFNVTVNKGTVEYPAAPTPSSKDVDLASETFTLPSDLKLAQKLTIKAVNASGSTLNEQTFTDLTAGGTVTMKLSDSIVQGEVTYTYTYTSDSVTYTGTSPATGSKAYYKSISNVTIGSTTLVYNGQPQAPSVSGDGEYIVETGYYLFDSDQYFVKDETVVPTENFSYSIDFGAGSSNLTISNYVLKVKGDENKYYKGEISKTFTITKRPVTLTVKNQDITYGESIVSNSDAVTVSGSGLSSGHTLNLTMVPSTSEPTQNGTVTLSAHKIMNGSEEVTQHYFVTIENNPGKLTISKIPMSRISVEVPDSVTYNGKEQTPAIVKLDGTVLTPGTDYTVSYEKNKNVGTATVTISNSAWEQETVTDTFEIKQRDLTPVISNADMIYNGSSAAGDAVIMFNDTVAENDGISAAADISYTDPHVAYKNGTVSPKTVTASNITLTGEPDKLANYNLTASTVSSEATISPRPVTVTASDTSKTYGDKDPAGFEYTISQSTPLADGEKLIGELSREAGEDVNVYPIKQNTLTDENNPDYAITFIEGTFTISRRNLTIEVSVDDKQYDGLTNATFQAQLKGVQNGEDITLIKEGVTAHFETAETGEDIAVTISEFTVSCTDEVRKNYELIQPTGLKASIYNTYDATEYTVDPEGWTNDKVTITPAEGYLISYGNSDNNTWETVLILDTQTTKEGQKVTFYLRNADTKAISLPETVTYFIDKTCPTGTISLGDQSWTELLTSLSFDLLFKDMQTVTITAEDTLSDISKIEYIESAEALTQADLDAATDWQTYSENVNVTLEDAKKFIYYAKITDNAGNIIYRSTDGAVYDTSAPIIDGVEETVYYTSQTVTVTDAHPDILTLNDIDVTSPFTLEGNTEATYIIKAVDKVGNSSTLTVTMKSINVLDDSIEDLNITNVTSDNQEDIQAVLDKINELLEDENLITEEKTELEDLKAGAEELLETIEKAKDDISTEAIQKTENLNISNITPENRDDLQDAKEALENALNTNSNNYTEKEQQEIRQKIDKINNMISSIEKVENVINSIKDLPNKVATDLDKETEQKLLNCKSAYDALSEYEKTLVNKEYIAKLEKLLTILIDYKIISGNGSTWTKQSEKDLTFVANGPYRKFTAVKIDGNILNTVNYTSASGSTVINLKASYLETLSAGKHTITVCYTDGEAEGYFEVLTASIKDIEQKDPVKTGDTANTALYVTLAGFSLLAVLLLLQRKHNH